MIETRIPEIDLDTLVRHVREEMERLHNTPTSFDFSSAHEQKDQEFTCKNFEHSTIHYSNGKSPAAYAKESTMTAAGAEVDFRALSTHAGATFVDHAYRAVLGRSPDPEGLAYCLEALCSGRISKAELVAHLRRSAEGQAHGVRLRGLSPALAAALLRKIPILGRFLRRLDALEHITARKAEELSAGMDALQNALEGLRQELFSSVHHLRQSMNDLLAKDPIGHLQNHARAIAQLREALADHQRRLASWVEGWRAPYGFLKTGPITSRDPSDSAHPQSGDATGEITSPHQAFAAAYGREQLLDAFYTALEEAFRGDSKDISNRLRFYLPYIEKLPLDLAPVPVVDAGCGRGEWLELLRSEGYQGLGVDMNRLMVARCREKGLKVVEADAITYLEQLSPGCVGAVTAFQLIEHLELEDLLRFLNAAYECLAPGGMLLCETPNPENLLVSSYSFHLDPTHRRPIPAPMAVFLLESVGFCDVAVVRPPRTHPPKSEEIRNLPPLLQKLLSAEEDYAVIGYKPPCSHEL